MPFNPNEHLIKLQGKDYLEVRWRLSWLREQHPDASIVTEIVAMDVAAEWAIIRATVTIPGGGLAMGTALQRPTAIAKDYIANGETSAIGRALGALGFGTQHAVEFDQGADVVDAPIERKSSAAANAPIAPLPAANLATHGVMYEQAKGREQPPPVAKADAHADPERQQAAASLRTALKAKGMTPADAVALAGQAWPHITSAEDFGTLSTFQLGRLADVVTGESVIDEHGKIVPALEQPTIVGELSAAMRS